MAQRPYSPAQVEFRQTHIALFAAVAVPGLLLTATGIVSLALHRFAVDVVLGVLTLAFAMWVVVGGFSVWLLVRRSEQKTRLQHDFVSNVSHELRTPLTGIRILVDTLKLGRTNPEQTHRCLELLESETARLTALVEEVLEFGRLQAGGRNVTLSDEAIDSIIDQALKDFEALRIGARVEVECIAEPGLRVRADRKALGQVLVNLLSNALKYGGDGKRIWVRATRQDRFVVLTVDDEGPGIPATLRRKIFEEFYRMDDEVTRSKPGTGLGLAIARRLVTAQHGTIHVEPRAEHGSRFVVTLPAVDG